MKSWSTRFHREQSETTWAYLAGLIEGDGTITLSVTNANAGRQKLFFHPMVFVSNCNVRLLCSLFQRFGGSVRLVTPFGQHDGYEHGHTENLYQWGVPVGDCPHVCVKLLPHLVGKRRQAEIVIEAKNLLLQFRGGPWHRTPRFVRARLMEFAEESHWWNREGWRSHPRRVFSSRTEPPQQRSLELVS